MILPQMMAVCDVLDKNCICILIQESEIVEFMKKGITPDLVDTDSQVFNQVEKKIPANIPLTSFSILFARLKGNFSAYPNGTRYIAELNDGDKVLILESCTHQVSCEDIGRYKIPEWVRNFTGKDVHFEIVAVNSDFSGSIRDFSLVIHCGGCVATLKQIFNLIKLALDNSVPVTNYGMPIAWMNGILDRVVEPILRGNDFNWKYTG